MREHVTVGTLVSWGAGLDEHSPASEAAGRRTPATGWGRLRPAGTCRGLRPARRPDTRSRKEVGIVKAIAVFPGVRDSVHLAELPVPLHETVF